MSFHCPLRRPTTITEFLKTQRPQPQPQTRHASLLRRPKRPYTFTQLVTLSDGSTYTHRTTSPAAIYKASKDTRNTALWNPSSQKLMNVEADEAGRLRAFRERFGRGWDAQTAGGRAQEEERRGRRMTRMRVCWI
ncbi:MAG: 54S ribosomal 36 protein [Lasallia pustulata]|uniref:54S ribosomal 36 protein n=1 Tax=Lasallia pustulata TaxID=136370 RepID=A0A5M8Q2D4_9LECA|nr:MAG: 54S ribosomal 36 protein [Lasallia pustulata]